MTVPPSTSGVLRPVLPACRLSTTAAAGLPEPLRLVRLGRPLDPPKLEREDDGIDDDAGEMGASPLERVDRVGERAVSDDCCEEGVMIDGSPCGAVVKGAVPDGSTSIASCDSFRRRPRWCIWPP